MWSRTVRVPQTCICEFRHTASRASLPHVAPVTTPGFRRRNASTSDKSFQGQLYDSTQQRVIREKAEQARFAEIRESRKAARGSGAWVPPFVLLVGLLAGWQLGGSKTQTESTTSTAPLGSISRPKHNTATKTLQAAWIDFRDVVGADNIEDGGAAGPISGDTPFCVLRPASIEEVSKIMRICHRRRIPIVTGLELHMAVPMEVTSSQSIGIDFSRLGKTSKQGTNNIVIQRGVSDQELGIRGIPSPRGHEQERRGFWDAVVDVSVVLADGTIVKTQRPAGVMMGYDMKGLFQSDEDTLGIWTEATLDTQALKRGSGSASPWLFRSSPAQISTATPHDTDANTKVLADASRIEFSRKMKSAFDPLCLLNCGRLVQMYTNADTEGPLILPNMASPPGGKPATKDA